MNRIFFIIAVIHILCISAHADTTDNSADMSPEKIEDGQLIIDAFNAMNPLSPEDIEKFRKEEAKREEAATKTPVAQIHTESRQLLLEPGKMSPPVILTPGYVGAIVFSDSTGAPWPIARAVIGNSTLFNLVTSSDSEDASSPSGDTHILYITPLREHANSNLIVHLQHAKTPLIIQLVSSPSSTSNRRHDGIINFLVNSRGPNASSPIYVKTNPTISDIVMNLLDGIPPDNAKQLKLTEPIQSWEINNKIYIRTKHVLLWPAYISYAESSNIHVYEFEFTPSFIVSQNGNPLTIKVLDQ